ncbi:DNA-binding transcriptional regulator CytR [Vibrio sp. 10N.286.49.B3]|uniref:DNA-binding transcriptional regulator CytR n=1 Tax=Vibrio sp. 10N.286.49.B3 TaxID=1880855 RepID=UPI000C84EB86|nr:DNA-binding transcriptional regulator CytR [Vibrio sp. 10N.286.49.B3]PMH46262.1 DNA-binding transcriptional regulator CytR [Vibrio sp. 10N.286.49.B3]
MATMKDVALLAGVSTATVSRALTAPEKVLLSTRTRVENAATTVGYKTTLASRTARKNDSKTIIVIVPDITDPYFSEIIKGIEDVAFKHNYLVLIGDNQQKEKHDPSFINLALAKQAEGMILLGADIPFGINKSDQHDLPPMVMACEYDPDLKLPTVHIDNLTSTYKAINFLIKLGHSKIAQISGPQNASLSNFRHQGYLQGLRRAKINIKPEYTCYGEFSYESGAKAIRKLFSLAQPPTAIFCHSDTMAIGAMKEIKRLGFRIPEDVSIVGFDDIHFAKYCDPPLTTVAQPSYEIGCEAMLMILERLQGNEVHSGSRLLDSTLVIRGSAACLTSF